MASALEPLQMLVVDSQLAIAGLGRLFIAATLAPPSAASVERYRRCLLERRQAIGAPLLGVFVPAATRPGLDADGRAAILRMWGELEGQLEGCAVWIRRQGFIGAIQRSLVTGLLMVRAPAIVTEVVSSADEAVQVLSRLDPALSSRVLAAWSAALLEFAEEHTAGH